MAEFVKRGKAAASHGIKATYRVKIGQKRARRTELQHAQKRRAAKHEVVEGRNRLTKWFKPKAQGESAEEDDDDEVDIYALREEDECSDDDKGSVEEEEEGQEGEVSVPSVGIGSSNVQYAHVSLLRNPLGSLSVFSLSTTGLTPIVPFLSTPHLPPDSPSPSPSPLPSRPISPRPNDHTDLEADDEQPPAVPCEPGNFLPPPSIESAKSALADIKNLLKPPRDTGAGYKDPNLDLVL